MNIGLVIYGKLDLLTGGFLYDDKVVTYLESQGHTARIISRPWKTYPKHLLDNFSPSLFREMGAEDLDVVIQDELNHPSLVLLNRALKAGRRTPLVSIVHHLRCNELREPWHNRAYSFVEKRYLASLDGFIYNSKTTRRSVEDLIGPTRSVLAYPGRDDRPALSADEVHRRSEEPGPLRILFVGSLIPRKELHTLVEAVSLLPKQSWRLDVVGARNADVEYAAHINKLIEFKALMDNITLHGPVPRAELLQRYASAHVLAVPSSYEGFGLVYLEGMGFGLPAIASNTGAACETVTPNRTGFLVSPGDARAIADNLAYLTRNRAELTRMGIAGLERFAAHPTWEQTGQAIEEFLLNVVGQPKS